MVGSWGNHNKAIAAKVSKPQYQQDITLDNPSLAHGNGRSYGDVALLSRGQMVQMTGLDRFIHFDRQSGVVQAEAGLTLRDLMAVTVPAGWLPWVLPGTSHVTLGGAVANDIHGKNQPTAGTFGNHVQRLALKRSDGEVLICSADKHKDLFYATIGGLGLTGVILWVELALQPIPSAYIDVQHTPFTNLADFFALSTAATAPYSVAWLDPIRQRGIFSTGQHAADADQAFAWPKPKAVPLTPPLSLINRYSCHAFNALYYKLKTRRTHERQRLDVFFFPLDGLVHWNRVYGRRGLLQFQCLLPPHAAQAGVMEILNRLRQARLNSFVTVLKEFGAVKSRGLLSFARPGMTLALDIPATPANRAFVGQLYDLVLAHGGQLYPAKDACMTPAQFAACYPQWGAFAPHRDPALASDFSNRVLAAI